MIAFIVGDTSAGMSCMSSGSTRMLNGLCQSLCILSKGHCITLQGMASSAGSVLFDWSYSSRCCRTCLETV